MNLIHVNRENVEREHICCAIAAKKNDLSGEAKKAWMRERFAEGLTFLKLDARGKVFIEYMPAENAWYPLDAKGYLHINCLWVSGQFKGKGYGGELMEACVEDAKARGFQGITALSSKKKMPFLSDPRFLRHKGFRVADTAEPFYELLYLPLQETASHPSFLPCCKAGKSEDLDLALYYTDQCPFSEKYAMLIKAVAERNGETLLLQKITTLEQAKAAPSPFTTYTLYDHGRFVTNEILSEPKFQAYLDSRAR